MRTLVRSHPPVRVLWCAVFSAVLSAVLAARILLPAAVGLSMLWAKHPSMMMLVLLVLMLMLMVVAWWLHVLKVRRLD